MTEIYLMKKILSILNFLFILFGIVGNVCTFLILTRQNIRKHSCMRYLAILCLCDVCCLFTWNFSTVYKELFRGRKIEFEGPLICRLFSFYSYFILQSSSWIICWIGMDRLITVLSKNSKQTSKFAKDSIKIAFIIISVFFAFNLIVFFNNALPYTNTNSTKITFYINKSLFAQKTWLLQSQNRTYSCYEPSSFYHIWDIIHILLYSIVPFIIILGENIALSYLTLKHARRVNLKNNPVTLEISRQSIIALSSRTLKDAALISKITRRFAKKKRRRNEAKSDDKALVLSYVRSKRMNAKTSQVTNLLLFLTVSFLCTSVPYSMFYALRLNQMVGKSSAKDLIVGCLTLLQYARHSSNFLIYLFTSSIIRNEIRLIREELRRNYFFNFFSITRKK